jgi:hypothetical protein
MLETAINALLLLLSHVIKSPGPAHYNSYAFSPNPKSDTIERIKNFNLVWNGKMDTITRGMLMKSFEEGNLIMVDLNNYIKLT